MKKSSPPSKVSKLLYKVNYTLSLANLINIFNWLKLSIASLTKAHFYASLPIIYLAILLAAISRLVLGGSL